MSSSRPQEFFKALREGGKGAIEALYNVGDKRYEEDWFDCKGCERIDDAGVKKTWSETISAFANTQGGVLIWGLDARKDPETNVDRIIGPSYVANVQQLRSRLQELSAQTCDPPLPGIEIVEVEDETKSPAGFVLCFIPEGNAKPYRAEQAGRNYFIRAGAATHIPPPALLRSLFFPKSSPVLSVHTRVTQLEDGKYSLIFAIHNSGTATAKDVLLAVQLQSVNTALGHLDHLPPWQPTMHPAGEGRGFNAYFNEQAIHPGQKSQVLTYIRSIVEGDRPGKLLQAQMTLYCENNSPTVLYLTYSLYEIEDKEGKIATLNRPKEFSL